LVLQSYHGSLEMSELLSFQSIEIPHGQLEIGENVIAGASNLGVSRFDELREN
jgi:hypothetical protein